MKISEIITDKYKLRIEPTVYYDLLADVREAEEEQELCKDEPVTVCINKKPYILCSDEFFEKQKMLEEGSGEE